MYSVLLSCPDNSHPDNSHPDSSHPTEALFSSELGLVLGLGVMVSVNELGLGSELALGLVG